MQWDMYLSGVLYAYRNTPHSSTGEKPSFLLFGFDCHHPTEAATLLLKSPNITEITDYREELVLNLSSSRALAAKAISKAQKNQKAHYDQHTTISKLRVGDWILIYFPQDETGKHCKLSRPWHGPYHIISRNDPHVTAVKIFFPTDPPIQVHQSRVNKCPPSFPSDFYWYGGKKSKPGRPTKRIQKQLEAIDTELRQLYDTTTTDDTTSKVEENDREESTANKDIAARVSSSSSQEKSTTNREESAVNKDTTERTSPSSSQEGSITKILDQKNHSQSPKHPYSLRSRHRQQDTA